MFIPKGHDKNDPAAPPTTCKAKSCLAAVARGDSWFSATMSLERTAEGDYSIVRFHHTTSFRKYMDALEKSEWENTVQKYDNNPKDFSRAWYFLSCHPHFKKEVALGRKRVFSTTNMVNLDISVFKHKKNSCVVSLEWGPYVKNSKGVQCVPSHDYTLDVKASSFEKAVLKLAKKVRSKYPIVWVN